MGRPKPPVGLFIRSLGVLVVAITTSLFKRRWRNLEGIPQYGPAIIAVNHVSYIDPFIVARFVWDAGRVPRYLAKSSLFRIPVIGWVIGKAGQIPVERGSRTAVQSLAEAQRALQSGEVVTVYPEGTVTRDPEFWPMSAKTGLARLALLMPDVPVIPVGQWGAQYSVDYYHRRFRPFPRKTVTMSVGAPVELSRFRGAEPTTQTLRQISDTVMEAVRDEVAAIRGIPAPTEFSKQPAGKRKGKAA
ncbi:MAG: lysophospholipid acyltransferase family protein [Jatrophihabitans sp.]